jgi:hypothetical protein
MAKKIPREELSGEIFSERRIVRAKNCPSEELSVCKNCPGDELSSEELSEQKIVQSKNCPGEELSE